MRLDSFLTLRKVLMALCDGAKVPVSWSDARAWVETDEDELYVSLPINLNQWTILSTPLGNFTLEDLASKDMFGDRFCPGPTFTDICEGNA